MSEIPSRVLELPRGSLGIHAWDILLVFRCLLFPWCWWHPDRCVYSGGRAAMCSKANGKRNAIQTNCACVCYEVCPNNLRHHRCSPHTPPHLPLVISSSTSQYMATNPATSCSDWPISWNFSGGRFQPPGGQSRGSSWTLITAILEELQSLALQ